MLKYLTFSYLLLSIFIVIPSFATSPKYNGKIIIGIPFKLSEINPFTTSETISGNILDVVYDTLIKTNSEYKIMPRIATRWDVSKDQLIWKFYLNDKVYFHDMVPLTSKDVKFTLDVIKKIHHSVYSSGAENIDNITIEGPDKIIIKLKKPDQSFPVFLSYVYIAPSHLFDKDGKPKSKSIQKIPIGSGPFFIKSISPIKAELSAFNNYYDGKPYLDEIVFKVYKNDRIIISKLLSGEVDIKVFFNLKYLEAIKNIPYLKIIPYQNQHLFMIFLNLKNPLFKTKSIRQALNYSINKSVMIKKLFKNKGQIASSVVSPKSFLINSALKPYEYEPKLALELFNKAGWNWNQENNTLTKSEKEFKFSVLIPEGSSLSEKVLNLVREDLTQLGIQIEANTLPMPAMMEKVFVKKDFDSAIFPYNSVYSIYFDYLFWKYHNERDFNFTTYQNTEVDRSLEQAKYALTLEVSQKAYDKFQEIIHDDPPMIYLFWKDMPIIVNKRVHGLNVDPFFYYADMYKVWVDN